MSDPIIHVDNVSKQYAKNIYRPSFRHEATQLAKRIIGRGGANSWQSEPFWALKDIDFEVQPGEAVAIIGRNGAGKTTLLRLLSNVTAPTTGNLEVNGRFTSLIGLGAGFNPERTGLQNIYLNCAIYGVDPQQVDEFIDDIIEFSELGDFINEPVKRYSSGMVARLGFSIAVHILPDIIFLDEILSVGDIAFQQKCEQRIFELRERNCTIIYVSHIMDSMRNLCERSIVLHKGEMLFDGNTEDAIDIYHDLIHQMQEGFQPDSLPLSAFKVRKYPHGAFAFADCASTDQETAKRFYTSVMGWEEHDIAAGDNAYYTMFKQHGEQVAGLTQIHPTLIEKGIPAGWNHYIKMDSLNGVTEQVDTLGGEVLIPPFSDMAGGQIMMIQDPTGAIVSLWDSQDQIGAGLVNTSGAMAWNELVTEDTTRAKAFYRELIGWEYNQFEINNNRRANGAILTAEDGTSTQWRVYFSVADIEDTVRKVKANGGKVETDVQVMGEGIRAATVTDPTGVLFGLIELKYPQAWK